MEKVKSETEETLRRVAAAVRNGSDPVTAINQNAHSADSYSAALKAYGLSPVIPD